MENFYTLEFKGSKGWEVHSTYPGLNNAIQGFRWACLHDDEVAWRLTTPMPTEGQ